MDPQLLRTLVAVARSGSFSAAARELGYTQSAVSQQIAALEADLGTPLLHRRPVAPTEAGARLLEHAGPILLRLDAARADVARVTGTPPGALSLGVAPLALTPAVASALATLRRQHPRIDLSVRVAGRATLIGDVATGGVDLALVDGVVAPSDPLRLGTAVLRRAPVAERPLAVALPLGHPLARRRGLHLADLVDARWIDAPEVAAPLSALRAAAGGDGPRPRMRYPGTDIAGLLALVAAGHGLAVLPAGLRGPGPAGPGWPGADLVAVALRSPRLVHRVELIHGHLSGAVRWLADRLTRTAESTDIAEPSAEPPAGAPRASNSVSRTGPAG